MLKQHFLQTFETNSCQKKTQNKNTTDIMNLVLQSVLQYGFDVLYVATLVLGQLIAWYGQGPHGKGYTWVKPDLLCNNKGEFI